ncbi:MAG TPA: AlwI family type II restriction endonuclease [Candidatus Saccharimonadales bacterium]|nr:AlwI family type II restriction endonuclease [Candidatus Saccharimonadales bacterium]
MKTWNLGNTTVRNPERIKAGLKLLKDNFEGRVFDLKAQQEFFEVLLAGGLIEGDPSQEKNKAASGRKWQSACNKLGLTTRTKRVNGVITVTAAGNALLSDDVVESDVFLRQMLKIQLPSPTESKLDNAAIHPFYLVLSVAYRLLESGSRPLGKEEIALYIQSATNDNQTEEIVSQINEYREARDAIEGRIGKRRYFLERLTEKAKELYADDFSTQKVGTLQDYSDTTARYSSITGVFTIGRQSLVIKEDQVNLAKALVEAGAPSLLDDDSFEGVFHNPELPALPTDDSSFLEHDIASLSQRLQQLSEQTGTQVSGREQVGDSVLQLKRRREDLEKELTSLKEVQFYRAQHDSDQVDDIKSLFESIEARETIGGSDYRPAWAEWNVWRVFLSINTIANPVSETRGFKINSELFPVHHAKGGAADLCFKYDDGTIVPAEITLSTNERQFNMEGEAVKFHVKSIVENNQSNDVIGVFTAPDVHVATAHEFYGAEFYSQKMGGVVKLNIVPLTFEQLQSLLPGQKNSCDDGVALVAKLHDLIEIKNEVQDGAEWLNRIGSILN